MNTFFVTFKLHNFKNSGWAYKTERKDDYTEALKLYHKTLDTYIGSADFDLVTVEVSDAFGNVLKVETWTQEVPVEEPVAENTAE